MRFLMKCLRGERVCECVRVCVRAYFELIECVCVRMNFISPYMDCVVYITFGGPFRLHTSILSMM